MCSPPHRPHEEEHKPENYGDLLNADTLKLRGEEVQGVHGGENGFCILDVATDSIGVEASRNKESIDVVVVSKDFNDHVEVGQFYSDDAGEFDKTARQLVGPIQRRLSASIRAMG